VDVAIVEQAEANNHHLSSSKAGDSKTLADEHEGQKPQLRNKKSASISF
jgi:hypothetical protein